MNVSTNPAPSRSALPGILHATLAGSKSVLKGLSVWTQVLDPGSATPPHRHDCEEVVLCSAGRGELRIDGRALPFGPNTTLNIPRNALHELVNMGDEPLHIIAIFSRSPVVAYLPDGRLIDLPRST